MIRHVVITGAAGGIGYTLVTVFRSAGYDVIATDCVTHPDSLPCNSYIQADLGRFATDRAYAGDFLAKIRDLLEGNGLHALINNAAVQILGGAESLSRKDWQQTLDINLLVPFFLTQGLLPELEATTGSVINIGSIHARLTKKNFVAYATSKAGLAGLTRALAVDLGSRVRVNAIEPAAIGTPMLDSGFMDNPLALLALNEYHPIGRIGRPEEVATLALRLVDSDIGFLTGACLSIDGGIGSRLHDPD